MHELVLPVSGREVGCHRAHAGPQPTQLAGERHEAVGVSPVQHE